MRGLLRTSLPGSSRAALPTLCCCFCSGTWGLLALQPPALPGGAGHEEGSMRGGAGPASLPAVEQQQLRWPCSASGPNWAESRPPAFSSHFRARRHRQSEKHRLRGGSLLGNCVRDDLKGARAATRKCLLKCHTCNAKMLLVSLYGRVTKQQGRLYILPPSQQ